MSLIADAIDRLSPIGEDLFCGTIGRRPSGARLYHRGSRFVAAPYSNERRRLDRAHAWRIIACAEALDAATRAKGMHGGVLKRTGIAVLRALLRGFYSYATGQCDPSYERIAEAAGCCRSTVAARLRVLEGLGILDTVRRKVVASFTSRQHRVRFDVAVQTSNAYRFNFPHADRRQHGDLALPLFARPLCEGHPAQSLGSEPESKFPTETNPEIKTNPSADPEAAIAALRAGNPEQRRLAEALAGLYRDGLAAE